MQQHMEKVHSAVTELMHFFNAVIAKDWNKALECHNLIMQFESDADELKKEIRLHLPNSLFMAIERIDLLSLLTAQDKIASKAKHISSIVYWRKLEIPEGITDDYIKFVSGCVDASMQAKRAINELDELIEAGFRGREVKIVADMILELDKLERETDHMQVELRKKIFKVESGLNPIDVIFLYRIIDWTGDLADQAQLVGHRLESLLAK